MNSNKAQLTVFGTTISFSTISLNSPYTDGLSECKIKLRWKQFLQQTELKSDGMIKCEPISGSLMSCPLQHIFNHRQTKQSSQPCG